MLNLNINLVLFDIMVFFCLMFTVMINLSCLVWGVSCFFLNALYCGVHWGRDVTPMLELSFFANCFKKMLVKTIIHQATFGGWNKG